MCYKCKTPLVKEGVSAKLFAPLLFTYNRTFRYDSANIEELKRALTVTYIE
jgi:hypothetical protein